MWSTEDYRRQWSAALDRLSKGAERDCLVLEVHSLQEASFVYVLGIWRRSGELLLNEFALTDEASGGVGVPTGTELARIAHEHMPPLMLKDPEDGTEYRHWSVPIRT